MGNKKNDNFKNFPREDRFKKLRITFEDRWETDFICAYEPTYPLWYIAINLDTPFLLIKDRSKYGLWDNTHDTQYIPKGMDENEIAAIAWKVWQNQFEPKMKEALSELILETAALTLLEINKKFPGEVTSIDATRLFNAVFRLSNAKKKLRLEVPSHGGARAKKSYFQSIEDEIEFVLIVMLAMPLWEYVIKFLEEREYDPKCIDEVQRSEKFEHFSRLYPVPQKLLKDAYKRKHHSRPELAPLGFALRHAGILVTKEEMKYNTLKTYFYRFREWIAECIRQHPGDWPLPFALLTLSRTKRIPRR